MALVKKIEMGTHSRGKYIFPKTLLLSMKHVDVVKSTVEKNVHNMVPEK